MINDSMMDGTIAVTANATSEEHSKMYTAANILDQTFVWTSMGIGIPGNLLIFLSFRTFPEMASTFMLKCMALFDSLSILLITSMRFFTWQGVVEIKGGSTGIGWTIYFNCSHFVTIFANNVFILVVMERLIFIRFPDMISTYISMDRVKLNLAIFFILFASFCIVVIIKMNYFGVAWIFVFTIFYSIWPLLAVFLMLVLIVSHYHHLHAERKKLERNKKLFPSHSSNVNKSPSKFSGISGSGSGAGSLVGSVGGSSSKKKNPYGALLMNKSASESFLSSPNKGASTSAGAIHKTTSSTGKGFQTEVNLKVPFKGGSPLFAAHLLRHEGGSTSEEGATDGERDEMETEITREILTLSIVFIFLMLPVCVIHFLFIQQNNDEIDPSSDDFVFLMTTMVLGFSLGWHATKFVVFFVCSSTFRKGILVSFKRVPRVVIETNEPENV